MLEEEEEERVKETKEEEDLHKARTYTSSTTPPLAETWRLSVTHWQPIHS